MWQYDSKPLSLTANAAHEAAYQLRMLSDLIDDILLIARDFQLFIVRIMYQLAVDNAVPDKIVNMLEAYRENLERQYKLLMERYELALKVLSSIVEEARSK
jgi:hypothetical protein